MVTCLLPISLFLSLPVAIQDSDSTYSQPPRLERKLADDFEKDSRGKYEISGQQDAISWGRNKLTLGPGSILRQKLGADSWIELELDLKFPELTTDSQTSDLKVWLDLEGATDCFVWFRQKREKQETRSSIFLVDTDGEWNREKNSYTLVSKSIRTESLVTGKWIIRYREGLVSVTGPLSKWSVKGYFENGAATVDQWVMASSVGRHSLRQITCHATSKPLLSELARTKVAEADQLNDVVDRHFEAGKLAPAIVAAEKVLQLRKQHLGRFHSDYASIVHLLGYFYEKAGAYHRAIPLYQEAKALREQVLGKRHPEYAGTLNNLAKSYRVQGKYEQAVPLYTEALSIWQNVFGKEHEDCATGLNNLAFLYMTMGSYRKAEPLYKEAIEIRKKLLGENDPSYASSLNNLAMLYESTKEFQKAEPLFIQAKAIAEKEFGNDHPEVGVKLSNLASFYHKLNRFDEAEPLFLRAKGIFESRLGKEHPQYAQCIENLAAHYTEAGKFEKAGPLLEEARNIKFDTFGKDHPEYAISLSNQAYLLQSLGQFDKAKKLLAEAVQITRNNLERYSIIQSGREQRKYAKSFEYRLSSFISCVLLLEGDDENNHAAAVWEQAALWKGISLVREKQFLTLSERPETQVIFQTLRQMKTLLSRHLQADPSTPNWKPTLDLLTNREAALERQLAETAAKLGIRTDASVTSKISLPANSCLIDYRRFMLFEPDSKRPGQFSFEPRYVGMVINQNGSVRMIDLGMASRIEAAIDRWREPIESANQKSQVLDPASSEALRNAGRELKNLIWKPLEKEIGKSRLVIVSPDGAFGSIPLIALPGEKENSYLLEDYKIVYAPVPGLLSQMLSDPAIPIEKSIPALLMGHVDYGPLNENAHQQESMFRNKRLLGGLRFSSLIDTKLEIEQLKRVLNNALELSQSDATESQIRKQIAGRRLIHFATHGFFQSPDRFKTAMAATDNNQTPAAIRSNMNVLTENPNLLSGLAVSNANAAASMSVDQGLDDGILFSAEIAMLPMEHVELAVLSACETGLGTDDNPGEGLIGIQRAFQVAGAKSVVASYWKVDDKATQLLMSKFYENLLKYSGNANPEDLKSNRSTIRIDALRDAQLWMLNNPVVASSTNRGEPIEIDPDKIKKAEKDLKPADKSQRTHPRYWAAFMLSGDWR